jgi:hypothetical protein
MAMKQIIITTVTLEQLAILINGESEGITDVSAVVSDECFEVSVTYSRADRVTQRTMQIKLTDPDRIK